MSIANKNQWMMFCLLLFLPVFIFSCNKSNEESNQENRKIRAEVKKNQPESNRVVIDFLPEEKDYIKTLKRKGKIVIATRTRKTIYLPQKDGTVTGFHYLLVKSLADYLGVELEVKLISFKDYFAKDGEELDKSQSNNDDIYTPDLIKQVDMYVDGFTILPWRERLLKFVKIYLTKEVILTRKGEELKDISELINKKIAIVPKSSFETSLKAIEKKLKIKLNYLKVNDFSDAEKAVSEGKADVTVQDSDSIRSIIESYQNLNLSLPISKAQYIGWALKKDNRVLAGIIEKYIAYAHKIGLFDQYWQQTFHIGYIEYLKFIGIKK